MIAPALFSSQTDQWATPPALFARLSKQYGPFDLDVCASVDNAKVERYYSAEVDGLTQPWSGRCWCNPPYGKAIGRWVRKAWESAQAGATVVCLLPARVDTRWWQDYVIPFAAEVQFIRGRVKFGGGLNSAPFPSAVVVFTPVKMYRCQWCEGQFIPARSDSKFCSVACKQAAYRARRAECYGSSVTRQAETHLNFAPTEPVS